MRGALGVDDLAQKVVQVVVLGGTQVAEDLCTGADRSLFGSSAYEVTSVGEGDRVGTAVVWGGSAHDESAVLEFVDTANHRGLVRME